MSGGLTASGPKMTYQRGRSTGWWGMVAFMTTEGMVFVLLLFVYYWFAIRVGQWPPEGFPMPELQMSGVRSLLLFSSSATMVAAERTRRRGKTGWFHIWLIVTLVLGGVFLAGHVREQFVLFEELAPRQSAYGSTFLTIVNFHAFHLIAGLIALVFTLFASLAGRLESGKGEFVENAGLYWHYVDVIWLFVYSSLYLTPYLR